MDFFYNHHRKRFRADTDRYDSDSDEDTRAEAAKNGIESIWVRYIVVEGEENSSALSTISPFAIHKWFQSITPSGIHSIKKIHSGAFLVDCANERASSQILSKNKSEIMGIPVKVYAHGSLNSSKGVIRCRELLNQSELEIKTELKSQGVLDARKVLVTKDGKRVPTSTLFLTFASPSPPKHVFVGYLRVSVSPCSVSSEML